MDCVEIDAGLARKKMCWKGIGSEIDEKIESDCLSRARRHKQKWTVLKCQIMGKTNKKAPCNTK
jgi:hypothetical protein